MPTLRDSVLWLSFGVGAGLGLFGALVTAATVII